jgi:hypothetical protein
MGTATHDISIGAGLTREQAEGIFAQGQEAVVFALLELAKQLAEAEGKTNPSTTPSTPSGMVPVYEKPPAKGRGKKRPGAKQGHPGSRREKPQRVDWQVDHRADNCPDCGGRLKRCAEERIRYIEDMKNQTGAVSFSMSIRHSAAKTSFPRPKPWSARTGSTCTGRRMTSSSYSTCRPILAKRTISRTTPHTRKNSQRCAIGSRN